MIQFYFYGHRWTMLLELRTKSPKGSRLGLGSCPQGGANEFQDLLTNLQQLREYGSTIFVGGTAMHTFSDATFKPTAIGLIDELVIAGLVSATAQKKKTKKEKNTPVKLFDLKGNKEEELQSCLGNVEILKAARAIDSHKQRNGILEFKLPRDFGNNQVVYTNSCKPDLTSVVRRMVFEVKGKDKENALLLQLLERVTTALDMSHILRSAIAFGATPDFAFVIIGIRNIPLSRSAVVNKEFHIYRVDYPLVDTMWRICSEINESTMEAFLTIDGALVWNGLQSLGLNPWVCRIHLTDHSQHRVYSIATPRYVTWPTHMIHDDEEFSSGRRVVCVDANKETFAMKVIGSDEAFARESAALIAIAPPHFYGSKSAKVSDAVFSQTLQLSKDAKNICKSVGSKGAGWWEKSAPAAAAGGVLFMNIGESVGDGFDPKVVFNDCTASLNAIHAKGFVHGDIRLPNILKFGSAYSLIDFGEAARFDSEMQSTISLANISADRRNKGPLEFLEAKENVLWAPKHDFEMLARAVFDVTTSAGAQMPKRVREQVATEDTAKALNRKRKRISKSPALRMSRGVYAGGR